MARPLRRENYTVGWVCALPVELAAAQEMLDEEHPDLERNPADNESRNQRGERAFGQVRIHLAAGAGRVCLAAAACVGALPAHTRSSS